MAERGGRRPLFICYVPGLDRRRVTATSTPHVHRALSTFPTVELTTLPSVELLPTLMTGVYPGAHRVWQVSLRDDFDPTAPRSLFERLPDGLTTTFQGLRQLSDPSFDLATVPPHRRRRLEQYRFKYTRREASDETVRRFGAFDTLLTITGDASRFDFAKRFDRAHDLLDQGLDEELPLYFLELYALDLFQHWHLDRRDRMAWALRETDDFIARLGRACEASGRRLLLLVDHGQEPVVGTIPLRQTLRAAGVAEDEVTYFMEVAQCRFWFHTARARARVHEVLDALPHTRRLDYRALAAYRVDLPDARWGETYLFADAGYIFFPHDFYRPLANLFLGLRDAYQRPRVWNPRHRGNHGYLPENPSELGFATLIEDGATATTNVGELIDVAPTALSLIGAEIPASMKGTPLFASGGG